MMKTLFFTTIALLTAGIVAAHNHSEQTDRQGQRVQYFTIKHPNVGKTFDGMGVVNGGGATSVLLKDYPEPQRSEILDMVYRPMWGASVSSLLVEIPGDGNSTQGSMPSHSHYRGDFNFRRGYMWWIIREAKRRNPKLLLDGTAWSMPGWVGNNDYWSDDAVNYYISWLKGLRSVYGIEMDALGCHNEKGYNYNFIKNLHEALHSNGFKNVRLHGFDNWGKNKMDFLEDIAHDSELARCFYAVSAHTFSEIPATARQRQLADSLNKPIWNTEDHIYKKGFDCLIGIVKALNENYIISGATRIINWYDIAGVYPIEPYSTDPPMLLAREPWSGHYDVRQALWGYAHYGQFTHAEWKYVDEACGKLTKGGSMVMMHNPSTRDYSIIIETSSANEAQTIDIALPKSFSDSKLCLWRSNIYSQFERMKDVDVSKQHITITVEPHSVLTLSTTRGQQKGYFKNIPASQPFPLPYSESYEEYTHPDEWGYLPHYTADIIGSFELVGSPDHKGTCIRQVVGQHTNSWAPEWHYYTIIGDSAWHNYEVKARVWLNPGDEAGVMGRVCHVGWGYGIEAKGYYLKIDDSGNCKLMITCGKLNPKELIGDAEQRKRIIASSNVEVGGEYVLDSALVDGIHIHQWHELAIRFDGDTITGLVDGKTVVEATDNHYSKGMAGLIAPMHKLTISTPYFDDLSIRPLAHQDASGTPLPIIKSLYPD